VHLIAGPWDADESGSALGSVPGDWWECNGRYRDTMRRFWAGEPQLGELAARLPGPSHSFGDDDRRRDER
jgi:isoamylase